MGLLPLIFVTQAQVTAERPMQRGAQPLHYRGTRELERDKTLCGGRESSPTI